jgi:hypothetical protein
MSIFDELPTALGVTPRDGFRACQYVGVGDVPAEDVRRKAEEIGGHFHREQRPRRGLRAGRLFASRQEVSWLEIPESAFDGA